VLKIPRPASSSSLSNIATVECRKVCRQFLFGEE
jgi:hypothetical protein